MTNNSYKRGRQLERELVNKARKEGLIAFRSAASKSPIDVCIIDLSNRKVQFIQAKTGILSNKAKERVLNRFQLLNGHFVVDFRLIHKQHAYSKKGDT